MKRPVLLTALCAFSLLASACAGDEKVPLEGQRVSLFDMNGKATAAQANQPDAALDLPAAWTNEFWPQAGGYANHAMGHLALASGEPKKIWSSSIGSGTSKSLPLVTQPVVADGRVYTLDTHAHVRAFNASNGKSVWSADAMPPKEDDPVIGGGLAFSGGRLFVTAGFNEVLALNPADGKVLWRAPVNAALRGAPTAMPDRVYVVTVDNETVALDAATGKQVWTQQGLSETTGLLGGASPAANRDTVLPAYSSGEVYALKADTGAPLWSDNVAPMTRAATGVTFSDIRGLPVIDHGVVIAISYGGRIAAIDERTGDRRWDAPVGGTQTPLVAGNRVFVVSSEAEVVSLDIANGKILWRTQLPKFKDAKDLEGPLTWYGPLLAGGRLVLFSSNGLARDIDPKTGAIAREWSTGQDVIAAPAIANGTLYLLSAGGGLTAWK